MGSILKPPWRLCKDRDELSCGRGMCCLAVPQLLDLQGRIGQLDSLMVGSSPILWTSRSIQEGHSEVKCCSSAAGRSDESRLPIQM